MEEDLMILYFSGTGNSEYVAKRIGNGIGEEASNLFEKIRRQDFSTLHSASPWIVVVPTYAWQIPRIVENWLNRTELSGSQDIYFVMTCGGNIGNAGKYLQKLCDAKGLYYRGCAGITMPENYIALFSTPAREEALKTIEQAEAIIDRTIVQIKRKETFPQPKITGKDRMNSGFVNDVFYPLFVHAKKFYVTDSCISCGKCEAVCPLSNIHLENGKPVWGKNCTHCMACICRCPKEAIEYGSHSKDKPRYTCPKAL